MVYYCFKNNLKEYRCLIKFNIYIVFFTLLVCLNIIFVFRTLFRFCLYNISKALSSPNARFSVFVETHYLKTEIFALNPQLSMPHFTLSSNPQQHVDDWHHHTKASYFSVDFVVISISTKYIYLSTPPTSASEYFSPSPTSTASHSH